VARHRSAARSIASAGGSQVKALLGSLRSLVLGETWTIPIGVAFTLVAALVLRAALPAHVWTNEGGFMLAVMVAATLAVSWRWTRS
jgi:hypothetical protein